MEADNGLPPSHLNMKNIGIDLFGFGPLKHFRKVFDGGEVAYNPGNRDPLYASVEEIPHPSPRPADKDPIWTRKPLQCLRGLSMDRSESGSETKGRNVFEEALKVLCILFDRAFCLSRQMSRKSWRP